MARTKKRILTPEQQLKDAFKYARYIVKTHGTTYSTAKHFKTNPSTVAGRLKLLIDADPDLYKKVCEICPRLGVKKSQLKVGRASGEITKYKKKVAVEEEAKKKKTGPIIYSQPTGYTIIDPGHKKTPKSKCKSLTGRTKGGRYMYTVSAKHFFTNGYQRFTVRANSPKSAIETVQRMIKHYGLDWLNPSTCQTEGLI